MIVGEGLPAQTAGEDADNVGAPADLFVQPFLRVVGPDLTPMRFGELSFPRFSGLVDGPLILSS